MTPSEDILRVDIGGLVEKACIWCGSTEGLTKSHIIPEFLGGSTSIRWSCRECNSFLGRKYEASAKRNALLASGTRSLSLASTREAFRYGRKVDRDNGRRVWVDENEWVIPVPTEDADGRFSGSVKDVNKAALKRFTKMHPDADTARLQEFLKATKSGTFRYKNTVIEKRETGRSSGKISISGMQFGVRPELLWKLLYELFALTGLLQFASVKSITREVVKVNVSDRDNRITFSPKFNSMGLDNSEHLVGSYPDISKIPFKPHHVLVLRLTPNLLLYLDVQFFGVFESLLPIGVISMADMDIAFLIDKVFFFPIRSGEFLYLHDRNYGSAENYHKRDCAMEDYFLDGHV